MQHGRSKYKHEGCRCVVCKADNALTAREFTAKNPGHQTNRWNKKKRILDQVKLTAGCIDCGYDTNSVALDFDHVTDKLFELSNPGNRSYATIFVEVMNCEVRCANCHRIKTQERKLMQKQKES